MGRWLGRCSWSIEPRYNVALVASAVCGFVGMARVGPHMGLMKRVEARTGTSPEVITFVSNEGAASAARIVKGVIVAPVSVV